MSALPGPACGGLCVIHAPHLGGSVCELPAGHDGGHLCVDCPEYKALRRAEMIAERVAAHKALRDLAVAPDED